MYQPLPSPSPSLSSSLQFNNISQKQPTLRTMASSRFPAAIPPPTIRLSVASLPFFFSAPQYGMQREKMSVRLAQGGEERPSEPSVFDARELVDFLYDDLPHAFDDQGIDRTAYDESVKFRDPIKKHDGIDGYLFYIGALRNFFKPEFKLHWVKQTGPSEITTRWTVVMNYILLPWKPELVLTGTSVMGVNPNTNNICTHVDYWDSIENNEYFSMEAMIDVMKQLWFSLPPDLEMPKYQVLKRTKNYEVRKYEPFFALETNASIQIVLSSEEHMNNFPALNQEEIILRKIEGGIAAVSRFSGMPDEEMIRQKEKALRSDIAHDCLKTQKGCLLACYNDPRRTWRMFMTNEVLIWLQDFLLE